MKYFHLYGVHGLHDHRAVHLCLDGLQELGHTAADHGLQG